MLRVNGEQRSVLKSRAIWAITIVYWLMLFAATHAPAQRLPNVPLSDKTEHLLSYGLLATLLFLAIGQSKPHWPQRGMIVLAIGMMYGAIDEWLQALPIVNRDCDRLDWFADTTGLAIAAIVLTAIQWQLEARAARHGRFSDHANSDSSLE